MAREPSYCDGLTDAQICNTYRDERDRMRRYKDRTDKVGREIFTEAQTLVNDARLVMARKGKEHLLDE